MQRGIGAYRLIKILRFALLIEKAVLMALCDKEIKLKIASREQHAACDGCPFAEGYGLALSSARGQRIATDDVLLQNVSETFVILVKKRWII